jgi:ribosomal-protein-alanine N-acetyltransferase
MEEARLEGPRIVVRSSGPSDAPGFVAYFERNRAHLAPWEPSRPDGFFTEPFWTERLRSYVQERELGTSHRLGIVEQGKNTLIGLVSLTSIVARAPIWNARVGYSLDHAHEGRGLMTEALGLVIRYAFDGLGLKRLLAGFMPQNTRSARVLERAGFVREGYHREFFFVGGRWEDHVETSLINRAWRFRDG